MRAWGGVGSKRGDPPRSPARWSALLTSAVWVALHVGIAFSYLDKVGPRAPYLAGVVLLVLGSALAVRPLWRPHGRPMGDARECLAIAAVVPLVSLLNLVHLEPDAVPTYADWAGGGVGVILGALVLRGRPWWAVASGTAMLAIQTTVYARAPIPFSWGTAATLASTATLWVVGSWALRRTTRRADALAADFRERAALESAERHGLETWSAVRRRRFGDLEDEVLPLFREVSVLPPDEPVPADLRQRADELAQALRDGLLARALMTPELRRAVRQARTRGTSVLLASELEDHAQVATLQHVVSGLLDLDGLKAITVRALEPHESSDHGEATLVLLGAVAESSVEDVLDRTPQPCGWPRPALVVLDEGLMLRFQQGEADGAVRP